MGEEQRDSKREVGGGGGNMCSGEGRRAREGNERERKKVWLL